MDRPHEDRQVDWALEPQAGWEAFARARDRFLLGRAVDAALRHCPDLQDGDEDADPQGEPPPRPAPPGG